MLAHLPKKTLFFRRKDIQNKKPQPWLIWNFHTTFPEENVFNMIDGCHMRRMTDPRWFVLQKVVKREILPNGSWYWCSVWSGSNHLEATMRIVTLTPYHSPLVKLFNSVQNWKSLQSSKRTHLGVMYVSIWRLPQFTDLNEAENTLI